MADDRDRKEPAITDMQARFVRGISLGLSQTESARMAGYAEPRVAGVALANSAAVRATIRKARTNRIDKLASLSLRELEILIRDRTISPAVRLNGIKLSLGMAGHTEKSDEAANPLNTKQVSEMTLEELNAFLAKESAKRAADAKPIIDHEPVQSTSNSLNINDKPEPLEGSTLQIEGDCVTLDPPSSALDGGPVESDPPPGVP